MSFGVMVWVFQHGNPGRLVRVHRDWLPVLLIVVVAGFTTGDLASRN